MAIATKADISIERDELYRMSLDEYHALAESGAWDETTPVELLDGLLVRKDMKSPQHENAIRWLNERLVLGVDRERFGVSPGGALTTETSEPEPDFLVIDRDAPHPYHPGTAALAIEVSWSSLRRDLRVKPLIYARAGIPVYWVVDLEGRRAIVHERPGPRGYARVEECDVLRAPHIGLEPISVADVLAAAYG